MQSRKKQQEEVDVVGGASATSSDSKSRDQLINERIGYKPHPKPNNLPSLFGNLQF
ncbi:UNVERIFIED_CONTAM: hypothetical protein FKN15_068195 [Acipenser sinensis]